MVVCVLVRGVLFLQDIIYSFYTPIQLTSYIERNRLIATSFQDLLSEELDKSLVEEDELERSFQGSMSPFQGSTSPFQDPSSPFQDLSPFLVQDTSLPSFIGGEEEEEEGEEEEEEGEEEEEEESMSPIAKSLFSSSPKKTTIDSFSSYNPLTPLFKPVSSSRRSSIGEFVHKGYAFMLGEDEVSDSEEEEDSEGESEGEEYEGTGFVAPVNVPTTLRRSTRLRK